MRGSFWVIFCGKSGYPDGESSNILSTMLNPNSCTNHLLLIFIDLFLLLISIFTICFTSITRPMNLIVAPPGLRLLTAGLAAALSLGYLSLGSWDVVQNLKGEKTILPLHGWLVLLFDGLTWGFLCITLGFRRLFPAHVMKPCLALFSLYAAFISIIALQQVTTETSSAKVILDICCSPAAALLLLCAFRDDEHKNPEAENEQGSHYVPLEDDENTTPFAQAGFLSRMSFSWLNPLMKKGKQKILDDADIPKLSPDDRAERCYHDFIQKLAKQKAEKEPTLNAQTLLPTIFSWQRKAILISGFFALIKVLTLSTGPLFLRAFINVAEGNESIKYQGIAITALLFLTKTLESLSERQWCFRTRLIGLQLRSMLSAAVYHKQLKLSSEAKRTHSPGEIINYLTVDAYRIGEFPFWFHQMWTVCLQMCLALAIIYTCVGPATIAPLVVIVLAILGNFPLGKLQQKYQTGLMVEQDRRLRAITESLFTMKVLKLHGWETSFQRSIERLRDGVEFKWLSRVVLQKGGYYMVLFWSFPILMSVMTFGGCWFFGVELNAANVFTFLATLRVVQDPVRLVPDVVGAYVQASVSLGRIARFLEANEMKYRHVQEKRIGEEEVSQGVVVVRSKGISWESCGSKPTLRDIDFVVSPGEKVAVCGEVGAGKSTLLSAILGEVPNISGTVLVYGRIAYVSQTAWIQTGTIRDNILFGSPMDPQRYKHTLESCSLVKDIEMLPMGDLTIIGERGVNLSGGQKQRVQLARALYQDADVYLLDDPFSAVDAHTASTLFNEFVMGALCEKTVLLVTHQVDFLPTVDAVLLMVEGRIKNSGTYEDLMGSSSEFRDLVNAHSETIRSNKQQQNEIPYTKSPGKSAAVLCNDEQPQLQGDQLIQQEERETGDNGLKPYIEYLRHGRGYLYLSMAVISHTLFLVGQSIQNYWLAANVQNSGSSELKLVTVYSLIGCSLMIFLLTRSFSIVSLSLDASRSIFSTLLNSLFRAPMSFFDATPLGRILSRVSSDMNIIDLDVAIMISMTLASTLTTYFSFGVMAFFTWEVLFVIVPVVYLTLLIQKYYFASAKELMRINGTTKSTITSNLGEAIAGASTIRAFGKEDEFFSTAVKLIDKNGSPFFHNFSANEWLIQRLEMLCTAILSCSALGLTFLPYSKSNSGFIGMALSYGLTLNMCLVSSVQTQCMLANMIVSAERLAQYMHIPSEAPEIVEGNRPASGWPDVGEVQICDLKVRYRPNGPLVIQGISCIFKGGDKIGIVGRTGSGKTTLISTLFRLVEPSEGKIIIDGIDISTIGLHDLRTNLGIIPQEPTLFSGSVRYNLDPLSEHTDQEIWQVLKKCQLREAVQEKEGGLESSVIQDGSNWSMGQRQLFCLGRALLKRRKILVLDEATASIDNATDAILQKAIRREFADCTVITVAHRIPTVMDCTKVLAVSDGKVAEFDGPMELISNQGSLFGQLVREYWSYARNGN